MRFTKIAGLVAAPFTPLHADGSLHVELIPAYADFLAQQGVKGVFVCGSTGEGVSLTMAEKKAVMKAWAQAANGRFIKIFMAGSPSVAECAELAAAAAMAGYEAVGYLPPYYFKPPTVRILADCCAAVAAAAPNLAFYYYHIPVLSGVSFPMLPLLEAIHERIPNFAGIKYTDENLMDYAQCVAFADGRYDLLWGRDEVMLGAMALGARGAVGSTFNYAAPIYHQMMAYQAAGNWSAALQCQQQSIEIVRLLGKYGGIRVGKAFMRAVGLDCGQFRLPIAPMSETEYAAFERDLVTIGFHQWIQTPYQLV